MNYWKQILVFCVVLAATAVPARFGWAAPLTHVAEQGMATVITASQNHPGAVAFPNGNTLLVWHTTHQAGNEGGDIFGRVMSPIYDWGTTPFQVNSGTGGQIMPAAALLADGTTAVVVWTSAESSNRVIRGTLVDDDGTLLSTDFLVSAANSTSAEWVDVVAISSTSFVVVWHSDGADGNNNGVLGQVMTNGGVAIGSPFVVNTTTIGHQNPARVASVMDDRFLVVWGHSDTTAPAGGDVQGVYGQLFTTGATKIGTEFLVNATETGLQSLPSVALVGSSFLVAWESDQGGDDDVYARRVTTDGAVSGDEFLVNTYTTGDQRAPVIAGLDTGSSVISWMSMDQSGDAGGGAYMQAFDAADSAIGDETRVPVDPASDQWPWQVFDLAGGDFGVTWRHSNADDISLYLTDVYVSVFTLPAMDTDTDSTDTDTGDTDMTDTDPTDTGGGNDTDTLGSDDTDTLGSDDTDTQGGDGTDATCEEAELRCNDEAVEVCEEAAWELYDDCLMQGMTCIVAGGEPTCLDVGDGEDTDSEEDADDGADITCSCTTAGSTGHSLVSLILALLFA